MEVTLRLTDYQSHLRIRLDGERQDVWDPVRKKYVVLSPEELVRQLLIQCLLVEQKARLTALSVERQIQVFGQRRRYDLMIHDRLGRPKVLVEVKAPEVAITQQTLDQIARYNLAFAVSWLIVSNGIQTFCMRLDQTKGSIQFLDVIPDFTTD